MQYNPDRGICNANCPFKTIIDLKAIPGVLWPDNLKRIISYSGKSEIVNLLSGLSGNVDMGGTWYDPSNQPLSGFMTIVSGIPGQFNYDYIASNGVCPDDTANIVVNVLDCVAGIEDLEFNGIQIYPNPSNGLIYISNDSETTFNFVVKDLNGRIISSKENAVTGSAITTLDLTDKMNGLYIVTISNGSTEKSYRIIKQ